MFSEVQLRNNTWIVNFDSKILNFVWPYNFIIKVICELLFDGVHWPRRRFSKSNDQILRDCLQVVLNPEF